MGFHANRFEQRCPLGTRRRSSFRIAAFIVATLLAPARAAFAQVVLGPEIAVDAPIIAAGPSSRSKPVIASDGAQFLVGHVAAGLPAFTSIGADGTSPSGASTALDTDPTEALAITYDGTRYLAAWTHRGADGTGLGLGRIARDSHVLDAMPTRIIAPLGAEVHCVAIASSGTSSLVAWQEFVADLHSVRLLVQQLGLDGLRTSAAPIVIVTGEGAGCPSLAFGGGQYLFTYSNGTSIDGIRFDANGARVDATPLVIAEGASPSTQPTVAFSSGEFLVSWLVNRGATGGLGNSSVVGARVRPDATVVDTTPVILSQIVGQASSPRVTARSDGWLVAWTEVRETPPLTYFRRIDAAGTVLDAAPVPLPGHSSWDPALGFDGTNNLIASAEATMTVVRISAQRISPSGSVLDTVPLDVGRSAADQHQIAMTRSSSGLLAAWLDDRDPTASVIQIATLGPDGRPSTTPSRTLRTASTPSLVVASDGSNYLVSWVENEGDASTGQGMSRIFAWRIGHDGTPMDALPMLVRAATTGVPRGVIQPWRYGFALERLIFDGAAYVLFASEGVQDSNGGLVVLRIALDSTVSESTGTERVGGSDSNSSPNAGMVDAATNGQNTLIAFGVGPAWGISTGIAFVRARSDGALIDGQAVPVARSPAVRHITVTASGREYLIAWIADAPNPGIHVARVTGEGVVTVNGATTAIPGDQIGGVTAAGAVNGFLLTWQLFSGGGLMGARVAFDGAIQDPIGVALTSAVDYPSSVVALPSSAADANIMIGYVRLDSTLLAHRAFVREIGATIAATPDAGVAPDASDVPRRPVDGCGCRVANDKRDEARSVWIGWCVVVLVGAARSRRFRNQRSRTAMSKVSDRCCASRTTSRQACACVPRTL